MTRRCFMKQAAVAATGAGLAFSGIPTAWAADPVILNTTQMKTYKGLRGLADTPYFELTDKGLLRLTVDGMKGGIDGHTHLNLNSLAGREPDLLKLHPHTLYFLPPDINASIYTYANQNNSPEEQKEMGKTIINTFLPWGSAVTDTHTIPNLLEEMDLLRIDKAVILPIHFGWPFGDNMTQRYFEAIERSGKADRFILCGSVKPTEDNAAAEIEVYHAKGLKGIKLHPNFARFYPNDPAASPVYEICGRLGLPVLIHSGRTGYQENKTFGIKIYTEDYSDLANYEAPLAEFPQTRFVLCHAGALQNEQAIRLAKQYPNVWLDIHGQGAGRIQTMIKELGPERLMYGSDWAFYSESTMLVRLLVATESDHTVRRMIFAENAKRFWGIT